MDVEKLKSDARGKWRGIIASLGIEVPDNPNQHGPCPACSGKDRFRFDDKGGEGMYFCNQCGAGDGFALVQRSLGLTFKEAIERVGSIVGSVDYTPSTTERTDSQKKKDLNALWASSAPLVGSDPVSVYLHNRGLVLAPNNVRFCPACYEGETKTKMHAMVARVTGPDGKPVTLHRTYLRDGKKADIKSPKKLMPHPGVMKGACIRLFAPRDVLGVAEGIETAVAATQLFEIPTWACVSASGIESFRPPVEIKKIVIFGDNDASFTGQKAAYRLAHELYCRHDRIVDVQLPEVPGWDWADVVYHRWERLSR